MPSIRLELLRDGLEDYEYLWALSSTANAVAKQPETLERARFLQRARELLSVPQEVVASSSRYTSDPHALYAFRRAVAEAILSGRALLAAGR